jgi:cardiolipin synthase
MTTASALVPLWNRAAEWTRRLAMVRQARSFLYLSTYYVEYDAYGIGMLTALIDAQRRGVAVNLLIDGFGQALGGVLMSAADRTALGTLLDELKTLGAVVTMYRPKYRLQQWLGGGQHVKIQVSEAGEALFSSSNLSRSSFEKWNEYSVALRGPVVRRLLESYGEIGGLVDEAHLRALDRVTEEPRAGGGSRESDADGSPSDILLDYWLCNPNTHQGVLGPLGWRGRNLVTDALVERIAAARRSVAMTSFYFKPVDALIEALVAAATRGVQIEVHHSHRDALPSTDLAWIAAAAHYDRLLPAGVRVYENTHGEHSKLVLIDGSWVAFGSYNFEHAAHDRLAEAMLASHDVRAVQPVVDIFAELRRHPDNMHVTLQVLDRLPSRLKTRRRLLGRFKRWM